MRPRDKVEALFKRYPQDYTFEEAESLHALHVLINTDEFYLMARGVDRFAPREAILCPRVSFARRDQNAWFLWAFAGPLPHMLHVAPYFLPMVGWNRRHRGIRWYSCKNALYHISRRLL